MFFLQGPPARAESSTKYIEKQIYILESETSHTRLEHSPPWEFRGPVSWFFLRPLPMDYDNTKECGFKPSCLDEIKYEKTLIQVKSADEPLGLDYPGFRGNPGTFLILSQDNAGKMLHRIAVRRSDDYIGYLTELIGVPFVYAPVYEEGLGHQTDRGIGADCVATLIYGRRRLGKKIPYVSPTKLYEYTVKVADKNSVNDIAIRAEDILHFGFQTAVISVDNPPIGKLSDNDKIIHSYHKTVEEVDFSGLLYRDMPFELLRWN